MSKMLSKISDAIPSGERLHKLALVYLKLMVIISGAYMSLLFNAYAGVFFARSFGYYARMASDAIYIISLIVCAGLYLLLFEFKFLEKMYARLRSKPKSAQFALVAFSMWCAGAYVNMFYRGVGSLYHIDYLEMFERILLPQWLMSAVIFVPLTLLYLFFISSFAEIIHSVFASLARYERRFLIIAGVVGVFGIAWFYATSSAYYTFDVMYSLDAVPDMTYLINPFHAWTYVHYSMQPNFAMPLMLLAEPFALVHPIGDMIARVAVQFVLLMICFVMLSRMVSKNPHVRLFALLIFAFSFQSMVLATVIERRIMALCFLIIALYNALYRHRGVKKSNECEQNLWFAVATGQIIVNCYVFLASIKQWKSAVKNLLVSGAVFVLILSLLGKIGGLINIRSQMDSYEAVGWLDAGYDFMVRLTHYLYLTASSIFTPPSQEVPHPAAWSIAAWGMSEPVTGSFFFGVGAVILLLALAGFLLNFKARLAQVALAGVVMSAYFVLRNGLNINENAVVLNTAFYGWAFAALAIMGVDKLLSDAKPRLKTAKIAILALTAAAALIWNSYAVYQINEFGYEHFEISYAVNREQ
jgi:hypothetical protein